MTTPGGTDTSPTAGPMTRAAAMVVWEQTGQRAEPFSVLVDHTDRAVLLTTALSSPRGFVRAAEVAAGPRWGGALSGMPRPAPGAFGDEPHIVKADRDRGRLAREARALELAAAIGVPAPSLRFAGLDATPPVLIMTQVPGLELVADSPDADWTAVGAVLRRWHDDAPTDRFEPHWPAGPSVGLDLLDGPGPRRRLTPPVRRSLAEVLGRLPGVPPTTVVLHGDCAPYHWFLDEGRVSGVIDFGDVGTGDPMQDLAVLTLWDHDRLPAVLAGYDADDALRARVRHTVRAYRVLRHLAAVAWLLDHDIDPEPTCLELERLADKTA